MVVSLFLTCLVDLVGMASGYVMSGHGQGASPGQFIANMTLLSDVQDFLVRLMPQHVTAARAQRQREC